jgi:hypothetical protein
MEMSTIPGNQNETLLTVKKRCGSSTKRTQKNLKRTKKRDFGKKLKKGFFRQYFIHFQFKNVLCFAIF